MGKPTPTPTPQQSTRLSLSDYDWQKWGNNVVTFLAPLGVIYFGAIVVSMQLPGHTFNLHDFVPTSFTLGAMALYVANVLYDLSRKFVKTS